jgi:hypothetical protein
MLCLWRYAVLRLVTIDERTLYLACNDSAPRTADVFRRSLCNATASMETESDLSSKSFEKRKEDFAEQG